MYFRTWDDFWTKLTFVSHLNVVVSPSLLMLKFISRNLKDFQHIFNWNLFLNALYNTTMNVLLSSSHQFKSLTVQTYKRFLIELSEETLFDIFNPNCLPKWQVLHWLILLQKLLINATDCSSVLWAKSTCMSCSCVQKYAKNLIS